MKWHQAAIILLASSRVEALAFAPTNTKVISFGQPSPIASLHRREFRGRQLYATPADEEADEEADEKPFNPYADPNYPDLEFVNYDDPEYKVDQGEEFFDASEDSTEAEIEAMREDRRRRNDEYQFETYHAECLKSGEQFKGEWTVYRTSTFMEGVDEEEGAFPRFKKEDHVRRVVSSGKKIFLDAPDEGFEFRVDAERLVHEERLAEKHDFEESEEWEAVLATTETAEASEGVVGKSYTPKEMSAFDFRGSAGAMCVGNCYTVSDATIQGDNDGLFSELRSEIGIQYKRMRYRVKWDYRVKEHLNDEDYPALHLHSMIVCRETRERWPRYKDKNSDDSISERLFGAPGAQGGLFDRPPVGGENQAKQYMTLNLEGGATVLFPHKIDQDPSAHDGNGWVQTIDWCPGRLRYQVDKKIKSGRELRGLKTLELTEILAADADQWKPNDDGSDMRQ